MDAVVSTDLENDNMFPDLENNQRDRAFWQMLEYGNAIGLQYGNLPQI